MLIESMNRLSNAIGSERIGIEVEGRPNGEVSIVLIATLKSSWHCENDTHGRARAALSRPLTMVCSEGEADSRIVKSIDQLLDPMKDASKLIPEETKDSTEDNVAALKDAESEPESDESSSDEASDESSSDEMSDSSSPKEASEDSGVGSL